MITRADWELRQRQWATFNRQKRTELPPERPPEDVLADLGTVWEWLPSSVRAEQPDPERAGIRRMHELLRLLSER